METFQIILIEDCSEKYVLALQLFSAAIVKRVVYSGNLISHVFFPLLKIPFGQKIGRLWKSYSLILFERPITVISWSTQAGLPGPRVLAYACCDSHRVVTIGRGKVDPKTRNQFLYL